eukprot:GHVN01095744.1.p1 GENE.GHVN01095744.1~~GHVN01095744.1.p1  ORF type:complete len:1465 (+),score=177.77 GHVN01095744.1:269-4663(+)
MPRVESVVGQDNGNTEFRQSQPPQTRLPFVPAPRSSSSVRPLIIMAPSSTEPKAKTKPRPSRSRSTEPIVPDPPFEDPPSDAESHLSLDVRSHHLVRDHLQQQQEEINQLREQLHTLIRPTLQSPDAPIPTVTSPSTNVTDPAHYLTQILIAQQKLQVDASSITAAWATLWVLNTKSPMVVRRWIKLARSITERVSHHMSDIAVWTQLSLKVTVETFQLPIRDVFEHHPDAPHSPTQFFEFLKVLTPISATDFALVRKPTYESAGNIQQLKRQWTDYFDEITQLFPAHVFSPSQQVQSILLSTPTHMQERFEYLLLTHSTPFHALTFSQSCELLAQAEQDLRNRSDLRTALNLTAQSTLQPERRVSICSKPDEIKDQASAKSKSPSPTSSRRISPSGRKEPWIPQALHAQGWRWKPGETDFTPENMVQVAPPYTVPNSTTSAVEAVSANTRRSLATASATPVHPPRTKQFVHLKMPSARTHPKPPPPVQLLTARSNFAPTHAPTDSPRTALSAHSPSNTHHAHIHPHVSPSTSPMSQLKIGNTLLVAPKTDLTPQMVATLKSILDPPEEEPQSTPSRRSPRLAPIYKPLPQRNPNLYKARGPRISAKVLGDALTTHTLHNSPHSTPPTPQSLQSPHNPTLQPLSDSPIPKFSSFAHEEEEEPEDTRPPQMAVFTPPPGSNISTPDEESQLWNEAGRQPSPPSITTHATFNTPTPSSTLIPFKGGFMPSLEWLETEEERHRCWETLAGNLSSIAKKVAASKIPRPLNPLSARIHWPVHFLLKLFPPQTSTWLRENLLNPLPNQWQDCKPSRSPSVHSPLTSTQVAALTTSQPMVSAMSSHPPIGDDRCFIPIIANRKPGWALIDPGAQISLLGLAFLDYLPPNTTEISFNGVAVTLPVLNSPVSVTVGNITHTLSSIPINCHPYSLIGLNLLPPNTPHQLLSLIFPSHFPQSSARPTPLMVSAAQKAVSSAQVPALQLSLTPGKCPIWQEERHQRPDAQTAINAQITELLANGIIQKVTENQARQDGWCSNLLVVPRKDAAGKSSLFRVTLDARKINEATDQLDFPFPHMFNKLRHISRFPFLGDVDFVSCFWAFQLTLSSSVMTTFVALGQYYRFLRMPFGLKQAPLWCQMAMERIMASFSFSHGVFALFIYLDNFVFGTESAEASKLLLTAIIYHLNQFGFELHKDRARHSQQGMEVLGMTISHNSLTPSPSRYTDLVAWAEKPPRNVREAMRVRGLLSYLRPFVPQLSTLLTPIDTLISSTISHFRDKHDGLGPQLNGLQLSNIPILWTGEHQDVVADMISHLATHPILITPTPTATLHIFTDASDEHLGGYVTTEEKQPVLFFSKKASAAEKKRPIADRELAAIYHLFLTHSSFLFAHPLILHTDNQVVISWIQGRGLMKTVGKNFTSSLKMCPRSMAALNLISQFQIVAEFISSEDNEIADSLSRPSGLPNENHERYKYG